MTEVVIRAKMKKPVSKTKRDKREKKALKKIDHVSRKLYSHFHVRRAFCAVPTRDAGHCLAVVIDSTGK